MVDGGPQVEEAEEANRLLKSAESCFESDQLREGGEKLYRAIRMAENLGNRDLVDQAMQIYRRFIFTTETRSLGLARIETDGYILDIGGGGEGVIGRLNGKQVIAVDTSEDELLETNNESLKVVMDATDLKFVPRSFNVCTAFFSLMYIPKNDHSRVFNGVHRVLKDGGSFLLWDVSIPENRKDYRGFTVRLKIRLPEEQIETAYGVKYQQQNTEHFRVLAQEAGFKIVGEWREFEVLFLSMVKRA